MAVHEFDERRTRELAALVGVDDLRLPITANRVLQRLDTKVRRQRRREPPGQILRVAQSMTPTK